MYLILRLYETYPHPNKATIQYSTLKGFVRTGPHLVVQFNTRNTDAYHQINMPIFPAVVSLLIANPLPPCTFLIIKLTHYSATEVSSCEVQFFAFDYSLLASIRCLSAFLALESYHWFLPNGYVGPRFLSTLPAELPHSASQSFLLSTLLLSFFWMAILNFNLYSFPLQHILGSSICELKIKINKTCSKQCWL